MFDCSGIEVDERYLVVVGSFGLFDGVGFVGFRECYVGVVVIVDQEGDGVVGGCCWNDIVVVG